MTALYDFQQWLDYDNAPDGPSEADDLERALRGASGPIYRSQPKKGGLLLITGKGDRAFLFHQADTEKHIKTLKLRFASDCDRHRFALGLAPVNAAGQHGEVVSKTLLEDCVPT